MALASPKSSTFTLPSGVTLMLAGLRSRWTMPFSCAYSSASAIWRAIGSASSIGIGPRDALGQRGAFHQLHHQGALFHAVNGRDIGMVQRRQHLRFARETRHAVGIGGEGVGQNFDGDFAVELGIGGAIDRAHAALAEFGGDAVMRDGRLGAHGFSASARFGIQLSRAGGEAAGGVRLVVVDVENGVELGDQEQVFHTFG